MRRRMSLKGFSPKRRDVATDFHVYSRASLDKNPAVFTIPRSMRAAVYRGANDVRIETVPVPRIGAKELLVKVAACGVCPTDIKKIQYATLPPPRIFGHETAGTIVKIGARVRGFRVGDRVALHHHVPCLDCHFCRHRTFAQCEGYKKTGITAGFEPAGGGFAEYVRVMDFVLPGVVKIPGRNLFEEGAMLEPVNTVLKAVRRLHLLSGDVALVAGQGPIGLMFTRLLALDGISVIATDMFQPRLILAKQFGARWTLDASKPDVGEQLARWTRGRGLDAAVIAAQSNAAVTQAITSVRGGGKVLLFAHTKAGSRLDVDLASICLEEKDLIGSYSADYTLQKAVAKLVFSKKLDVRKLISHRFGLEQTGEGIHLASNPGPNSQKILISPLDTA